MRAPATAAHQSPGHHRHRTTSGRCSLGSVADRVRGLEHRRQAARRRRAPARVSALAGEGAGGGAAASSPTGHGGRRSSVAGGRNGEGERNEPLGLRNRTSRVFDPPRNQGGRRISSDGQERPADERARIGPRGRAARAVSAARPLAVGLQAQKEVAEPPVSRTASKPSRWLLLLGRLGHA